MLKGFFQPFTFVYVLRVPLGGWVNRGWDTVEQVRKKEGPENGDGVLCKQGSRSATM